MKIHEHQAKELFKKYRIPIPDGGIALTPDEAKKIACKTGSFPVVIKGQIHAGGRGKGEGIKLAKTVEEVESIAKRILGMLLITHQTGPEGRLVKKVLVEKSLKIEKELYLSIIPDRATAKIVIIASKAGGMDIEEVAAKQPEKIVKIEINPLLGIQPFHCRQAAFGLELPPSLIRQFTSTLINLYRLFVDYSGAVGADKAGFCVFHIIFDFDHVHDRDAFCYSNNQLDSGIYSFQNSIHGKSRRDKNHAAVSACIFHGFFNSIEYRHIVHFLAALARGYPCHYICTIGNTFISMKPAFFSCYSLNQQSCIIINKNAQLLIFPYTFPRWSMGTRNEKMP